jgi:hypothetical protein
MVEFFKVFIAEHYLLIRYICACFHMCDFVSFNCLGC